MVVDLSTVRTYIDGSMHQLSIFSAEPLSVAFEDVFLLDSSVSQTASLYRCQGIPICSMYGIFTYVWVIFGANVGKYSIHGAYGHDQSL